MSDKKDDKVFDLTDTPKTSSSIKSTKVKIIRKHPIDGNYIVITDNDDFYLVPTEELEYTVHWQDVSPGKLSKKPYDWSSEIKEMKLTKGGKTPDKKDILFCLYRGGHVSKDDTKGINDSLWSGGIRQGGNK